MSARTWHSTSTGADHTGYHTVTLLKALESGELHGSQRKPKGRWRIHVDCLDAWVAGEKCEHQQRRRSA